MQAGAAAAGSKSVDADGDTNMDGAVAMEVATTEGAAEQSGALCTPDAAFGPYLIPLTSGGCVLFREAHQ